MNKEDPSEDDRSAQDELEPAANLCKAEVKRKLALLEFTLETVPEEIFVKDRRRRLIVANRAFLESYGLSREEALGKSTDSLVHEDLMEISRESDAAVLERGEHYKSNIVETDPLGNDRFYEVEKMPLREDDEIIGVLCICRNITDRTLSEQRLKEQETLLLHASRLSTIGELVAGIAHEINQPLYSILNYAQAVRNALDQSEGLASEDVMKWIDQILHSAVRGGEVTKRLRDFARRNQASMEALDCDTLICEAIEFVREEATQAGVEIATDLCAQNCAICVDKVQIQQVLVNLLKNSIESFALQQLEGKFVEISSAVQLGGVKICVRDNGPGIPHHLADEVFEAFFTTKNDGIGLGLPISKSILRSHGSKLTLENPAEGGTVFHFTLQQSTEE